MIPDDEWTCGHVKKVKGFKLSIFFPNISRSSRQVPENLYGQQRDYMMEGRWLKQFFLTKKKPSICHASHHKI
jgi:hypothetical protein